MVFRLHSDVLRFLLVELNSSWYFLYFLEPFPAVETFVFYFHLIHSSMSPWLVSWSYMLHLVASV